MSAVKKTAKTGLYIFSFIILLLIGGGAYLYINMNSLAKQISENVASDALGVAVRIGSMDISLSDQKIIVSDISIANPKGYKKPHAITIKKVTVAGESFTPELLVFKLIEVAGTDVNLEVNSDGTNLGSLKNNIATNTSSKTSSSKKTKAAPSKGENIKVVVKKFSLISAKLNPSVTLLGGDMASITTPDIHLNNIGEKENGIIAQEAVAQIMDAVLIKFNKYASGAGFLKNISLDALSDMALDKAKGAIKGNVKKEVEALKQGLGDLKGMFQ